MAYPPQGAGAGTTEEWLHERLKEDLVGATQVGLPAPFEAVPATGTFTATPELINDGATTVPAEARAVDQYAEVLFSTPTPENINIPCIVRRWRQFGDTENVGDGFWKLQYWNLLTNAWVDWVTGIPTRALASWSNFTTETAILTTKIRLVCTAVDSGTYGSNIRELEVLW